MTSVIIAAHDEAAVIGRCLDSLAGSGLDVVVVPNGCTDATAAVAAAHGARVVEVSAAGKAGALNAGDAAAGQGPRVYLDADIVVPPGGIQTLVAAFAGADGPLAVVPARRLDVIGRPWPVRAYFAINGRLPAYRRGLFGRGLIVLSPVGRARFADFPLLVADDLFLDSQFSEAEKATIDEVVVTVATPRRTPDLLRRLVRVRRGNAAMRHAAAAGEIPTAVRPANRWAWLTEVVAPQPWLLPAGVVYAAITAAAGVWARLAPDSGWGRDESTRT